MELFLILVIQILLFIFIVMTFKCKNNIWYVLLAIGSLFAPVVGLIVDISVIVMWYIEAFDIYPNIEIKNHKLNRWLYADYFTKK